MRGDLATVGLLQLLIMLCHEFLVEGGESIYPQAWVKVDYLHFNPNPNVG